MKMNPSEQPRLSSTSISNSVNAHGPRLGHGGSHLQHSALEFRSGILVPMMACLAQLAGGGLGRAADQFVLVTQPGWTNSSKYSWSAAWGDYDKDGFLDLFVPNTTSSWTAWTNVLYRNNGDGTFTRTLASQVGPIASDKIASAGAYWWDVNNDGHLDMLFTAPYSPDGRTVCRARRRGTLSPSEK